MAQTVCVCVCVCFCVGSVVQPPEPREAHRPRCDGRGARAGGVPGRVPARRRSAWHQPQTVGVTPLRPGGSAAPRVTLNQEAWWRGGSGRRPLCPVRRQHGRLMGRRLPGRARRPPRDAVGQSGVPAVGVTLNQTAPAVGLTHVATGLWPGLGERDCAAPVGARPDCFPAPRMGVADALDAANPAHWLRRSSRWTSPRPPRRSKPSGMRPPRLVPAVGHIIPP